MKIDQVSVYRKTSHDTYGGSDDYDFRETHDAFVSRVTDILNNEVEKGNKIISVNYVNLSSRGNFDKRDCEVAVITLKRRGDE